uniref:Uncharacterized protein n=1 Tax=Nyctotherus ovalis TaxID=70075 RepID=Q5DUY4_NYCOV|nr:hypothetical protein [Nyctotherus ovalis]
MLLSSTLSSILQILLISSILLLYLNVATYAYIFLSICFMVLLGIQLGTLGLNIFALLLIAAEIHTYYLIMCVTLLWYNHETLLINNLATSSSLLNLRVVLIIVLILGYTIIATTISCNYYNNIDIYIQQLLLLTGVELISVTSGVSLSIITTFATCILTIQSLEFLLMNIYMLLAVFIYHHVVRLYKSLLLVGAVTPAANIIDNNQPAIIWARTQSQSRQLLRVATIHSRGLPSTN